MQHGGSVPIDRKRQENCYTLEVAAFAMAPSARAPAGLPARSAAAKKRKAAAYSLLSNLSKMVRKSLALKLLLLAFMATVFVLASNLDAFLYMNRYFWFRKARNATAFFFIFLGAAAVTSPGLLSSRIWKTARFSEYIRVSWR